MRNKLHAGKAGSSRAENGRKVVAALRVTPPAPGILQPEEEEAKRLSSQPVTS